MIGAIVLAAGVSARLGSPKQLIRLGGETLLDRAIRMTHEAGCMPVVVVLGAYLDLIEEACCLQEVRVVRNTKWFDGMGSSLCLGVQAVTLDSIEGVIVLPCDMPAISAPHLRSLQATGVVTASRYAGRNGIPAFFPRSSFHQLSSLRGDVGARDLLTNAASIDLANGEMDVDIAEDVQRFSLSPPNAAT